MNRQRLTYRISEVLPYINWAYFYHAWQVKDHDEQQRLRHQAVQRMRDLESDHHTYALFAIGDANSDGDDILFSGHRLPMLRQQKPQGDTAPCLCLADFIRPIQQGIADTMGIFVTSVDIRLETEYASDDFERMMMQLIADRLAEATAEKMHEDVRRTYWGYAPCEQLTIEELHAEKFQGIRPAVGYPSLPDQSEIFDIDSIMPLSSIGISLTENGAMSPAASTCGLVIAHPESRYFTLGPVGDDQQADYQRRRTEHRKK